MIDFGYGAQFKTIDQEHLGLLRDWRNAQDIWKWTRQNDLITPAHHLSWYENSNKDPSIRMYLVCAEGVPVGVAGLTSLDFMNRRAEFSLYIGPNKRGQKYGEKALKTLLAHGFNNLNLNQIWGETFAGNPAIKLFLRIGFREDGVRRQFYWKHGEYLDAIMCSILRKEWLETWKC